jgi:hypothetical protein
MTMLKGWRLGGNLRLAITLKQRPPSSPITDPCAQDTSGKFRRPHAAGGLLLFKRGLDQLLGGGQMAEGPRNSTAE